MKFLKLIILFISIGFSASAQYNVDSIRNVIKIKRAQDSIARLEQKQKHEARKNGQNAPAATPTKLEPQDDGNRD